MHPPLNFELKSNASRIAFTCHDQFPKNLNHKNSGAVTAQKSGTLMSTAPSELPPSCGS